MNPVHVLGRIRNVGPLPIGHETPVVPVPTHETPENDPEVKKDRSRILEKNTDDARQNDKMVQNHVVPVIRVELVLAVDHGNICMGVECRDERYDGPYRPVGHSFLCLTFYHKGNQRNLR